MYQPCRRLVPALLITFSFLPAVAAEAAVCGATDDGLAISCAPPAPAGVALLAVRMRRTLRAADDIDGQLADSTTANDSSVTGDRGISGHSVEIADRPTANDTEGNSSEALLASSESPSVQENASAMRGLEESASRTNDSTMRGLKQFQEKFSTYSLSSAGRGSGLSSTEMDNSSLPPISEERFEPFGYPGAGLLLELHLPVVTLRELHSGSNSRGSLAQFLLELRGEVCKGADVQESRVSMLGIYGRYKRFESGSLFHSLSEHSSELSGAHLSPGSHIDEEVVVRFEILPGWSTDPDPRQALLSLKKSLNLSDSELSKGPLSAILANATVTLSAPLSIASQPRMVEHRGMAHMSAMAWPIGISAAFIGILIWLAAY